MTIKQQGGVFGRNPSFNDVETNTVEASTSMSSPLIDTLRITDDGASSLRVYSTQPSGRGLIFASGIIYPSGNSGASNNNGTDLGSSSVRFKNIYAYNVNLADGGGIDFSATSGTGTSELFNDYEEGTWTGTYGGNTAEGTYTKIGRAVYVDILLSANSASFSTITGLPYTCAGAGYSGGFSIGRVARMDFLDANGVPCRVSVSGTTISFTTNVATGGDAAFTVTSDASGTVRAGLSGVYYV